MTPHRKKNTEKVIKNRIKNIYISFTQYINNYNRREKQHNQNKN